MRTANLVWPAALSLMAVFLLSSGCEGPQGPPGVTPPPLPYVTGQVIFAPSYWDSTVNAIVQISWAPSWPVVKVNGVDCPAEGSRFGGELQFSSGNVPVSPGDSVSLSINYLQDDGAFAAASANIVLPGQFYIASPDTADTVQLVLNEGELTATWTRSEGADLYDASLWLNYAWVDTFEGVIFYWIYLDTLLTDTTLHYSSTQLFPDPAAVDSFDVAFGEFRVTARCGPWQPGQMGNVGGDAMGFFYGITLGDTLELEVVYPE